MSTRPGEIRVHVATTIPNQTQRNLQSHLLDKDSSLLVLASSVDYFKKDVECVFILELGVTNTTKKKEKEKEKEKEILSFISSPLLILNHGGTSTTYGTQL